MALHQPAVDAVRRGFGPLLAGALLAAVASLAPVAPVVPGCAAAGQNHAAVLVEHGDGTVVARCVAFDAASISAEELLNRSGVAWSAQTFGGFGDAVCALDAEPVRYSECPGKDRYWAVFVARAGGSWQLANVGISTMRLADGDAEGFRYVPASGLPAVPATAAAVCAAAAATTTAPSTSTPASPTPARTPTSASPTPARTPTSATATAPSASASASAHVPPSTPTPPLSESRAIAVATIGATPPPEAPAPTSPQPGGPDVGLLAAALAGGGLAGLALLRLLAARAQPR